MKGLCNAMLMGTSVDCAVQAPFYVVVETSGSNEEHDGAKMSAFLERVSPRAKGCLAAWLCRGCRVHHTGLVAH